MSLLKLPIVHGDTRRPRPVSSEVDGVKYLIVQGAGRTYPADRSALTTAYEFATRDIPTSYRSEPIEILLDFDAVNESFILVCKSC